MINLSKEILYDLRLAMIDFKDTDMTIEDAINMYEKIEQIKATNNNKDEQ